MSDLTPGLFINDVSLGMPEQAFTWAQVPGPYPYMAAIKVTAEDDAKLRALQNPVTLTMQMEYGVGENPRLHTKTFQDLYLLEPDPFTEFETTWKLADNRFLLRGKKAYYAKNITRVKNDRTQLAQVKTPIANDNPAKLRAVFDTFANGRYLLPSVQNGRPITIDELLNDVLFFSGFDVVVDSALQTQGGYVLENLRADGEDLQKVLAELLIKSRLNMVVLPDGRIKVYSLDFFEDTDIQRVFTLQRDIAFGPGRIYKQDKTKTRPSEINVKYEKITELRLRYSRQSTNIFERETGRANEQNFVDGIDQQNADLRRAGACINVVRIPFVPEGETNLDLGTYMPFEDFIDLVGVREEDIRQFWNNDGRLLQLIIESIGGNINFPDPISNMILGVIKQHYRQVFQIDPFLMDRIRSWSAVRSSITDFYSGYRAPSPLWADYTILPRGHSVQLAQGKTLHTDNTRSYRVADVDPNRENATLGTITVVNQDLGIFAVSYPSLQGSVLGEVLPCALEVDPEGPVKEGKKQLLAGTALSEDFFLETLVSVQWNYDHEDKFDTDNFFYNDLTLGKYFSFSFPPQDPSKAQGPPLEIFSTREYARTNEDGEVQNGGLLRTIAETEALKIEKQFQDRFAGAVKLPGWQNFDLQANVKSVAFGISKAEGATTTINMLEVVPDIDIKQALPEFARRRLLKQLDPGDG